MPKRSYYIKPLIRKEKIKINLFFKFDQSNLLANCYYVPPPGTTCCTCGQLICSTGAHGPPFKC